MRTVTAFYDSMTDAQAAASRLAEMGVDRETVSILDQGETGGDTTATSTTESAGFFGGLRELFMPEEDRYAYAEGIRRGGALMTAEVAEGDVDRVVALLDETGAVDIDERASDWRNEGWTGYEGSGTTAAGAGATAGALSGGPGGSAMAGGGYAATGTAHERGTYASEATATGRGADLGRDEAHIPIVEEQLRVGKREVGRGTVRVRSYVVETPVEQDVTLRSERVTVERRAVDRPADELAADAFRERSFEVTETAEEAVVDKTARVTEELVLRKDLDERTQTIADTVRRTEVEVEDSRTDRGLVETDPDQRGKA